MVIEINIEDIIWNLNQDDRIKLFKRLQTQGFIPKNLIITELGELKIPFQTIKKEFEEIEDEFNMCLKRLYDNGWRMTKEEEEYIKNISKRFS